MVWLTVTKVVFEYGVLPSAGPLGIWLTVTKVVFEYIIFLYIDKKSSD